MWSSISFSRPGKAIYSHTSSSKQNSEKISASTKPHRIYRAMAKQLAKRKRNLGTIQGFTIYQLRTQIFFWDQNEISVSFQTILYKYDDILFGFPWRHLISIYKLSKLILSETDSNAYWWCIACLHWNTLTRDILTRYHLYYFNKHNYVSVYIDN